MARTDKDKPYRVVVNDPALRIGEDHLCGTLDIECDIDVPYTPRDRSRNYCHYVLDPHCRYAHLFYYRGFHPHHKDAQLEYWVPQRARVRETLGNMLQEVRRGIDLDEFDDSTAPLFQHRNARIHGRDRYWD